MKKIKRYFWYRVFLVSGIIADIGMKLTLKAMNRLNSLNEKLFPQKDPEPKSSFSDFIKDTEKK